MFAVRAARPAQCRGPKNVPTSADVVLKPPHVPSSGIRPKPKAGKRQCHSCQDRMALPLVRRGFRAIQVRGGLGAATLRQTVAGRYRSRSSIGRSGAHEYRMRHPMVSHVIGCESKSNSKRPALALSFGCLRRFHEEALIRFSRVPHGATCHALRRAVRSEAYAAWDDA
jgi:hypothetical protein